MPDGASTCTRCGADLSSASRLRFALTTLAFAVIAVAFISLLIYLVLWWHESQLPPM
ncbi:MAG: hypothetical protein IKF78_07650 [Atopobiaceae bacterium]|nr:hypothetical protein [Atopobiaceae bacterium]